MMRGDPQKLINKFGKIHQNALRLAEVVSIAVRVEPELLRLARLTLIPEANAGDEADLWFSPLVKVRNIQGFVFYPEVAQILRMRLARKKDLLDDVWDKLFTEVHNDISPAMLLEEEITWLALKNPKDPKIEDLLQRTLATLLQDDDLNGVSHWFLRAIPNLPSSIQDSDIFKTLEFGANLRVGVDDLFFIKNRAKLTKILPYWGPFLSSNLIPDSIGVRFVEDGIEFGDIDSLKGAEELKLPPTNPLIIDVSWREKSGKKLNELIFLRQHENKFLSLDVDEVELNTLSGERYKLYKKTSRDFSISSLIHEQVLYLIREAYENNLELLDLSNKELTYLPLEITKIGNLAELNLFSNLLISLPPEIGKLKSLKTLDLSYNNLNQLSPEIGELKNLRTLNLQYNQLTKLPSEIGELNNLKSLDLSRNQLNQLPPEIGELKNLVTLNLQNNQLVKLPSEIGELDNLKSLDLSNNPLISPPPEIVSRGLEAIFAYLKHLKTTGMTFKEIEFGMHAAEDEKDHIPSLLIDSFLDDHNYIGKLISGIEFLVIGPRGSGKSAIASNIELMRNYYNYDVSSYYLENLRHSNNSYELSQNNLKNLTRHWNFVLLVTLLKIFINDVDFIRESDNYNKVSNKRLNRVIKVSKFLGLLNWEGFHQLIRYINSPSFQDKLKKLGDFTEGESYDKSKFSSDIKRVCYSFKLNRKKIIVIDDLDNVFHINDNKGNKNIILLSSLIISVNEININLNKHHIPAKIIVFCKQDIFEMKTGLHNIRMDFSITLNWYQRVKDKSKTDLAKMLNLRAKLFLNKEIDVLKEFFPERISFSHSGKVFKRPTGSFLFSFTRYLPRDLIQLMRNIQFCSDESPTNENIVEGIYKYSTEYFLGEIKDEMNTYFDNPIEIDLIIQLLRSIGVCRFNMQNIYEILEKNEEFRDLDIEKALDSLYKCSAIGNINKNYSPIFKCTNQDSDFKKNQDIIVHRGLWFTLNLCQ